ncbi:hypothetical protein GIB67_028122 [Kingdonia uniflora]|uniref:Uncharacterized protein n=1 Tax=Kingdonia uniflora TaxID=39325 RepID=A0A7J7KZM6_9MAGN|nr:hypothetical protein GIB67_028122 [Kingdonia uniflora]
MSSSCKEDKFDKAQKEVVDSHEGPSEIAHVEVMLVQVELEVVEANVGGNVPSTMVMCVYPEGVDIGKEFLKYKKKLKGEWGDYVIKEGPQAAATPDDTSLFDRVG